MLIQLSRIRYLLISLLWVFQMSSFGAESSDSISIYDALRSHGLPMGLLPKGVKNYTLDDSGKFMVHLDEACNAKFESELHYDLNVSGRLSFGQIGNLSGISAQELFLWFPVKGIRVDVPSSGLIYFDVGVVYKQFSLSLFESPPDCVAAAHPPNIEEGRLIPTGLEKNSDGVLRSRFDEGDNGREVM
ncbi:hypothetical protein Ancab_022233 [Ancistrocladus abbreviatus]